MSTLSATNLKNPSSGSNNIVLGTDGSTTIPTLSATTITGTDITGTTIQGTIKSGTSVASTSGTSIDFTGLPSWVKRVTVMFNQVSLSGSSQVLIQLGDSGGIETTSYVGGTANIAESTGFQIFLNVNTRTASGLFVLTNLSGNIWVGGGTTWNTSETNTSAGVKQLSGTLDQVRITTVNGTDTFDAGSINILYEG